jgi:hypothetical protein
MQKHIQRLVIQRTVAENGPCLSRFSPVSNLEFLHLGTLPPVVDPYAIA